MERRSAWMGRDGPEIPENFKLGCPQRVLSISKTVKLLGFAATRGRFGPPKFLCYNAGAMQ